MCITGWDSCYLSHYRCWKGNCFSTVEVKLASTMRQWAKKSQWWQMTRRSVLHTRAGLHSWGSNAAPALSISTVIYSLREAAWKGGLSGIWLVHAASTSNVRWERLCAREAGHGKQERKAWSLWGTDFSLWHDITFWSIKLAGFYEHPRLSTEHFSKIVISFLVFLWD